VMELNDWSTSLTAQLRSETGRAPVAPKRGDKPRKPRRG